MLHSRDRFRELVFERDGGKCVFCDKPAEDAHHILERRLWPDGGYYLDNGASVCGEHHMQCESTDLTVEDVRRACGITRIVVPPHLYQDQPYDKWGNPVLSNGQRVRGELFFDESVQKVLAGKLHLFTHWVKYPRTYHLPWSPGMGDDDRMMQHPGDFVYGAPGRVIATEKMDGECTTMYRDHYHARSVDSANHPSRNRVKAFWGQICGDIPDGWRVCGENLFARHSIAYDNLPAYFMGFSIWNEKNICLSWDDTLEWFELLGITPVPVLYDGDWFDLNPLGLPEFSKIKLKIDPTVCEGYVLRVAGEFPYHQFRHCVGKYVRADHVQTVKHWMHGQPVVPNGLA